MVFLQSIAKVQKRQKLDVSTAGFRLYCSKTSDDFFFCHFWDALIFIIFCWISLVSDTPALLPRPKLA